MAGRAGLVSIEDRTYAFGRRHIALKEMRETLFWLRLLHDSSPQPPPPLHSLMDESDQLIAILTATLKTARRNDRAQGT
jgi:four helix bundle protein